MGVLSGLQRQKVLTFQTFLLGNRNGSLTYTLHDLACLLIPHAAIEYLQGYNRPHTFAEVRTPYMFSFYLRIFSFFSGLLFASYITKSNALPNLPLLLDDPGTLFWQYWLSLYVCLTLFSLIFIGVYFHVIVINIVKVIDKG